MAWGFLATQKALAAERSPPSCYETAAKIQEKLFSLKCSCVEFIFLAQANYKNSKMMVSKRESCSIYFF